MIYHTKYCLMRSVIINAYSKLNIVRELAEMLVLRLINVITNTLMARIHYSFYTCHGE